MCSLRVIDGVRNIARHRRTEILKIIKTKTSSSKQRGESWQAGIEASVERRKKAISVFGSRNLRPPSCRLEAVCLAELKFIAASLGHFSFSSESLEKEKWIFCFEYRRRRKGIKDFFCRFYRPEDKYNTFSKTSGLFYGIMRLRVSLRDLNVPWKE